jgi:hypothetical protein
MSRCWETLSKKETVWIIIVVGLGLGSAAFAFAAQATRVKVWCRILFLFSFWGGALSFASLNSSLLRMHFVVKQMES